MLMEQGSLVKYSTPVLVSGAGPTRTRKTKREEQPHHTEDILGTILPPKQHNTDNGQFWVQTVLSTPATKIQVIQLHQELDRRLLQRQAREIGLCPVREELFDQCFDEIIRQITIDCRQRGLLLVKVRDEYRNQTKAYKRLYESSINHAMRRVIESDQKKQLMGAEIAKLEKECGELQRNVQELSSTIVRTKEVQNRKLKEEAEAHKRQVDGIKETNQKLKQQIQHIMEGNK